MPHIDIKDEAHWLAVRDMHIGGSEVAALFSKWLLPDGQTAVLHAYEEPPEGALLLGSCSPYTNAYELFLNKSGKLKPKDWVSNERMDAGTYLEPALAEWAKAKYDWKLRKVRRYSTHPTIEGWGCSVDFEVHGRGMEPVEFKNIDFLIARDKWQIVDGEVIVPPLHIILQLQHYIGARGSERGWIVACVGGNELVRGSFDAHTPTIERIGEAVAAFWAGVRADHCPEHLASFETAKEQFAFGRTLKDTEAHDLTGDGDAARLARRYLRWAKHLKFTEGVVDNIKGGLAIKVGEATRARGDGFKVTWPAIQREEKTIPAKIQKAMSYRGAFTVTEIETPTN